MATFDLRGLHLQGEAQANANKGTAGFRETLDSQETLHPGRKLINGTARGLPSLLPAKSAPGDTECLIYIRAINLP